MFDLNTSGRVYPHVQAPSPEGRSTPEPPASPPSPRGRVTPPAQAPPRELPAPDKTYAPRDVGSGNADNMSATELPFVCDSPPMTTTPRLQDNEQAGPLPSAGPPSEHPPSARPPAAPLEEVTQESPSLRVDPTGPTSAAPAASAEAPVMDKAPDDTLSSPSGCKQPPLATDSHLGEALTAPCIPLDVSGLQSC